MKKIKSQSKFSCFLVLVFIPFLMYSMSLLGQSVTSVSPLSGSAAMSQTVTITGTGFVSGNTQVFFGNVASPSVTVISPTSLTAATPIPTVPGVVDITVTTPSGTSPFNQNDRFAFTGDWLAFIPDFSSSQVYVIDTTTNMQPMGSPIGVGGDPNDISISPDGKTAYCVNSGSDSISVIDVATLSVTRTINLPAGVSFPILMALSQDPVTLHDIGYTANFGSGNTSQIDLTAGSVLQTVNVGSSPTGVMVTSMTAGLDAIVYVTNTGSGSISRIDFSTPMPTVTTISTGGSPSFIALAPDGTTAYFTDDSANTVSQLFNVNTASPSLGNVVHNEFFNFTGANLFPQIAIAPQVGYPQAGFTNIFAYVTNTGNSTDATAVSPLNITDANHPFVSCSSPFTAGIGPNGMAVTPDGNKGYVCNTSTSNEVTIISGLPSCSATSMNVVINGTLTDPSITPDQAPLAHFSAFPTLAVINQPILFDASSSVAPVGSTAQPSGIFNYLWDFGDGSTSTTPDPMIMHAYASPGTYTILLTVTSIGGSSTAPSTYFNGQFLLRNGEAIASGFSAQYQLSVTVVGSGNMSTTTVTSSLNPSTVGDAVTFTATVTGNAGFAPTGTVDFFDNSMNFLGTGTLVPSSSTTSTTSITTSALSAGSHVISARYSGDVVYMASAGALTQQVNPIPTTTTIISNTPNPSIFGQTVTFVAHVATPTGTLNGTVNFIDVTDPAHITIIGSAVLDTSTNNATLLYSGLSAGSHLIEATYIPSPLLDPNHSGSTSPPVTQVVNPADTMTTVVTSGSPSVFGQPVTFTATVSIVPPGSGSVVGDFVSFYDGSTLIGAAQINGNNQAIFTTVVPLAVGTHTITAVFNDIHGCIDPNFNSSSGSVIQQVIPDTTTTTLTSSLNPAVVGQSVTFTATVTSNTPDSGIPTGTVTFIVDGEAVSTVPLVDGEANFKTSTLSPGEHTIVAVYSGDTNHQPSTSEPLIETILSVAPPRHLKVVQVVNKFASQEDRINIITWKAPHMGEVPVAYKIYRNAKLTKKVATIRGSEHSSSHAKKFKYKDHNRRENKTYVYYIVSIDRFGNVSPPAKVVLHARNSSRSGSSSRSN